MLSVHQTLKLTEILCNNGILDTVGWLNSHSESEALHLLGLYANIDIYTGLILSTYITNRLTGVHAKRDFVNIVSSYLADNSDILLGISGLRSTGKTTGVLQALHETQSSTYILITAKGGITCTELCDILECDKRCIDAKNIVIDEITYVSNLYRDAAKLSSYRARTGKRLILTGTNSFALLAAKQGPLFHDIKCIDVTFISYVETHRTLGVDYLEYLCSGGLYNKGITVSDFWSAFGYVDETIIDNIATSLALNFVEARYDITGGMFYGRITELRTLVFTTLLSVIYRDAYSCIYADDKPPDEALSKYSTTTITDNYEIYEYLHRTLSDGCISVKWLCSLFEEGSQIKDKILARVSNKYQVDTDYKPQPVEVSAVLILLQQLRFLEAVNNSSSYQAATYNYYITNTAVAYQLLMSIAEDDELSKDALNSYKGKLLEANVMVSLLHSDLKWNITTFFLKRFELDIVLDDAETSIVIEVKYKESLIKAEDWYLRTPIKNRFLVYLGEHKIIQQDDYLGTSPYVLENKQYTVGIECLAVDDFLLHIDTYLI